MIVLGLVFGAVIGGLVLVAWYRWNKTVKGDAAPAAKAGKPQAESLEAFIAAYRRGEVSVGAVQAPPSATPGSVGPVTAAPAPTLPAAESVGRREVFLSGAPKLVYLACKSGLRDHHCFAYVRLQALCTGKLEPPLQSAEVDLLVCNASLSVVAAIDIVGAAPAAADAAKAECLRGLGIRYLRLSPKSLPKPEEIRTLLYRM